MAVRSQPAGVGTLAYPFYTGERDDAKPQPAGDDAVFYELDTRRVYVWKSGAWHLHEVPVVADFDGVIASINELRAEVETLRLGMIAVGTCSEV